MQCSLVFPIHIKLKNSQLIHNFSLTLNSIKKNLSFFFSASFIQIFSFILFFQFLFNISFALLHLFFFFSAYPSSQAQLGSLLSTTYNNLIFWFSKGSLTTLLYLANLVLYFLHFCSTQKTILPKTTTETEQFF